MIATARLRAELAAAEAGAGQVLARLDEQGARPARVTADSRAVRRGDLFLACPGAQADGRRFVAAAVAAGAGAVAWEAEGARWDDFAVPARVPQVGVAGLRRLAGPLASAVFGRPSEALWVAGITGTNGKTSTSQWVAQALSAAGRRCAVVGTLGAGFPGALVPSANTTPEATQLQEWLAGFRSAGAAAAAMEVSSIGLDQNRVDGIAIRCAVLTNLTRDHLDYHGSMERYREAKERLFAFPTLTHAVLNLDDPFGRALAADPALDRVRRIGYTLEEAPVPAPVDECLRAVSIGHGAAGASFRVEAGAESLPVDSRVAGRFNVANLLAVIGVLRAFGLSLGEAAALVPALQSVPGRMERFGGERAPLALVDYAHTPDALEKLLGAAREIAAARGGRLTAVFGCGGDRDPGKRPLMGAIAATAADRVVVTTDNPRSEAPAAIIGQVLAGVPAAQRGRVSAEPDRARAIAAAIGAAAAADVVVIAGKGHEAYQEAAGVRTPFLDAAEARRALGQWRG